VLLCFCVGCACFCVWHARHMPCLCDAVVACVALAGWHSACCCFQAVWRSHWTLIRRVVRVECGGGADTAASYRQHCTFTHASSDHWVLDGPAIYVDALQRLHSSCLCRCRCCLWACIHIQHSTRCAFTVVATSSHLFCVLECT
jgi:hypothetical protein